MLSLSLSYDIIVLFLVSCDLAAVHRSPPTCRGCWEMKYYMVTVTYVRAAEDMRKVTLL